MNWDTCMLARNFTIKFSIRKFYEAHHIKEPIALDADNAISILKQRNRFCWWDFFLYSQFICRNSSPALKSELCRCLRTLGSIENPEDSKQSRRDSLKKAPLKSSTNRNTEKAAVRRKKSIGKGKWKPLWPLHNEDYRIGLISWDDIFQSNVLLRKTLHQFFFFNPFPTVYAKISDCRSRQFGHPANVRALGVTSQVELQW